MNANLFLIERLNDLTQGSVFSLCFLLNQHTVMTFPSEICICELKHDLKLKTMLIWQVLCLCLWYHWSWPVLWKEEKVLTPRDSVCLYAQQSKFFLLSSWWCLPFCGQSYSLHWSNLGLTSFGLFACFLFTFPAKLFIKLQLKLWNVCLDAKYLYIWSVFKYFFF